MNTDKIKKALRKIARFRNAGGSHGHKSLYTPLGSVYLHKQYSWEPQWFAGRGERLGERVLRMPIPLSEWAFELKGPLKSYRELVEAPKYLENLDWVIDEFDSSFNDLACASLRYHLDFAVTDNESRREKYEDLIARLSEPGPEFTDEEMEVLQPATWKFEDDFEKLPGGGYRMTESNPEQKAIYATYWKREEEYHERIQQARHDFVDIMRHLWS